MPHRMMRREFALAAGAGAFGSSGVGWPVRAGERKTLYFIVRNDLRVRGDLGDRLRSRATTAAQGSIRYLCSTPVIIAPAIFMWNVEKGLCRPRAELEALFLLLHLRHADGQYHRFGDAHRQA